MNEGIKQRWVTALRSGEYEQGTTKLRRASYYPEAGEHIPFFCHCCLGVLCELYAADHPEAKWRDSSTFMPRDPKDPDGESETHLPGAVADWAGFTDTNDPWPEGYPEPLSVMNDDGKTFAEIADIIEKNEWRYEETAEEIAAKDLATTIAFGEWCQAYPDEDHMGDAWERWKSKQETK